MRKKAIQKLNIEDFMEEVVAPVSPVTNIPKKLPKKEKEAPPTPKKEQVKVKQDGYFIIEVQKNGDKKITIPSRGYKLKSWLDFERSLGYEPSYREVNADEFAKYHWSNTN
jgi:hypothetical protein